MKTWLPPKKTLKAIKTEMEEIFQKWRAEFEDKPNSKVHLFGKLSDDFYYDFYNDFIKLDYKTATVIYDAKTGGFGWKIDLENFPEIDWSGLLKEIRKRKNELLNLCNRRTMIWIY